MKPPLVVLLLLACGRAGAAPPLAVPDAPPGISACGQPGWQSARQLAAPDRGAGFLVESGFEPDGWSGRLEQRSLAIGIGGALSIGTAPIWEAGALLTGDPAKGLPAHPAPEERKIYTQVRKPDQSVSTAAFEWSKLGSEERAWLDLAPSNGAADGLGEARVAWLRGERTREIGQPDGVFRRRASLLGDTIRSTPLLVAAPSAAMQGPGYAAFHELYKGRANAIYLGANDGMLHAFDARDGAELFAYVARALLPALNLLTDPAYRHRAYVDASAGQGEASVGGQWRSVLVSGMGMGARGVFALDVTDPAAFDAGMGALWEFTEQDDAAMGHVSAAPLIAKLKIGVIGGLPQYRYFALVASGINNYGQDGDPGGALFLLALDKPASARWKQGENYYRLAAPASDPALANALAAPSIATAVDGSARYAYAGDLQGTLWRFDFTGKPPYSSAALFEARDAGGRRQPVTQAPRVVFAPGGGYLVLFGTGKLIEEADLLPSEFTSQSFYAVRDSGASPPVKVKGREELERRILSGDASYAVSGADFDYTGQDAKKGWYFDFPQAGERLAAAPVPASGAVVATTIMPGLDPCAPSTRTYLLDAVAGLAFKPDGKPGSGAITGEQGKPRAGALPIVLDMGVVTGSRGATGGARATRKIGIVHLQGKDSAPDVRQVEVGLPARRISWREVANWQELHDAAKKK